MAKKQKRIEMRCDACGAPYIERTAYAAWNSESQTWEMARLSDAVYCRYCVDTCKAVEYDPEFDD
jgi:NAD-dependent dihydropyrimidine dehydrogenase PreA subunit